MSFDACIDKVLAVEGGYVNDPADSGGETNWGITIGVARAFGYMGAMQMMTRDQAKVIYRKRYWDALMLDEICFPLSPAIAHELFDTAVNRGPDAAGRYLQRALNVLNKNGTLYKDLVVDGRVGPITVAALREFLMARNKQGETVMLRALNSLQGADYIELAEARQKDEKFVYGWLLNRVEV
jgi:lysozyme family protein